MALAFHRIALLVKPSERDVAPLEALMTLLIELGAQVRVCENSARLLKGRPFAREGYSRLVLGAWAELAIVLGGDGSLLGVARHLGHNVPIIGVNTGRLGFITDVVLEDMAEVLPKVLAGEFTRDARALLKGDIVRNGEIVYHDIAVNDIGITHGRVGGMVEFVLYVNGQPMSSQMADGIICASPTGSTAYSLASGGPIMHPSLSGICLVPVAPHTLSSRPIVLPGDAQIEIEVIHVRDAVAYWDMQEFFDVQAGDRLRIRSSQRQLILLHPEGYDYYGLLRQKLKWNFMPISEHTGDPSLPA